MPKILRRRRVRRLNPPSRFGGEVMAPVSFPSELSACPLVTRRTRLARRPSVGRFSIFDVPLYLCLNYLVETCLPESRRLTTSISTNVSNPSPLCKLQPTHLQPSRRIDGPAERAWSTPQCMVKSKKTLDRMNSDGITAVSYPGSNHFAREHLHHSTPQDPVHTILQWWSGAKLTSDLDQHPEQDNRVPIVRRHSSVDLTGSIRLNRSRIR